MPGMLERCAIDLRHESSSQLQSLIDELTGKGMPVTFNRVCVRIQVKGVYEPKDNGGLAADTWSNGAPDWLIRSNLWSVCDG